MHITHWKIMLFQQQPLIFIWEEIQVQRDKATLSQAERAGELQVELVVLGFQPDVLLFDLKDCQDYMLAFYVSLYHPKVRLFTSRLISSGHRTEAGRCLGISACLCYKSTGQKFEVRLYKTKNVPHGDKMFPHLFWREPNQKVILHTCFMTDF